MVGLVVNVFVMANLKVCHAIIITALQVITDVHHRPLHWDFTLVFFNNNVVMMSSIYITIYHEEQHQKSIQINKKNIATTLISLKQSYYAVKNCI